MSKFKKFKVGHENHIQMYPIQMYHIQMSVTDRLINFTDNWYSTTTNHSNLVMLPRQL